MIKTLLSRLLPREDKFHRLLRELAALAAQVALYLKNYVEAKDAPERASAMEDITRCRMESKRVNAEITRELCATFVTPFDREDIQDFALSLYKIVKTTKKICDRLEVHGMVSEKGDFSRQTDLIVQESQAMEDIVRELTAGHDTKRIMKMADMLYEIENKGDIILSELLSNLFREQNDARILILRKDIYDMLEKIIDRYRNAAGVAMQIVLKHS